MKQRNTKSVTIKLQGNKGFNVVFFCTAAILLGTFRVETSKLPVEHTYNNKGVKHELHISVDYKAEGANWIVLDNGEQKKLTLDLKCETIEDVLDSSTLNLRMI